MDARARIGFIAGVSLFGAAPAFAHGEEAAEQPALFPVEMANIAFVTPVTGVGTLITTAATSVYLARGERAPRGLLIAGLAFSAANSVAAIGHLAFSDAIDGDRPPLIAVGLAQLGVSLIEVAAAVWSMHLEVPAAPPVSITPVASVTGEATTFGLAFTFAPERSTR